MKVKAKRDKDGDYCIYFSELDVWATPTNGITYQEALDELRVLNLICGLMSLEETEESFGPLEDVGEIDYPFGD